MNLTLKEKKKEAGDAISFIFEPEAPVTWTPGQYLHYTLPHEHADERNEKRWFTISSAPHEGRIVLTTRVIDAASSFKKALVELPIGGTIAAERPEGDFIIDDPNAEFVFIAGGIGITPYRAILKDLDHKRLPFKAALLYGNRNSDFFFKDELDDIAAQNPNFKITYIVAPDHIDEAKIREAAPDLSSKGGSTFGGKNTLFYISGPEPMVEAFEKMMLKMGIPDEHLKRDFFPGYEWPIV